MELEEIKNAWALLDQQLKKNQSLKETIIRDMIHSKTRKQVNRLIFWEIVAIVICLLVAIGTIQQFGFFGTSLGVAYTALKVWIVSFCIAYICWGIIKTKRLASIDFAYSISHNINLINKYGIQMDREKLFMTFIGGPLFVALTIFCYVQLHANAGQWAFMICVLIASGLISYWSYKKLYPRRIETIRKKFEELEELEESQ